MRKLLLAVALVLVLVGCAKEETRDGMEYRVLYLVNPATQSDPMSLTEINSREVIFAPQWCQDNKPDGDAEYVFQGKEDGRCHWLTHVDDCPKCVKQNDVPPAVQKEVEAEDCFPHCDNAYGWERGGGR